jgi:hypothetical protein
MLGHGSKPPDQSFAPTALIFFPLQLCSPSWHPCARSLPSKNAGKRLPRADCRHLGDSLQIKLPETRPVFLISLEVALFPIRMEASPSAASGIRTTGPSPTCLERRCPR